jgi:hypothetical protein
VSVNNYLDDSSGVRLPAYGGSFTNLTDQLGVCCASMLIRSQLTGQIDVISVIGV